jgi:hypothetical protein
MPCRSASSAPSTAPCSSSERSRPLSSTRWRRTSRPLTVSGSIAGRPEGPAGRGSCLRSFDRLRAGVGMALRRGSATSCLRSCDRFRAGVGLVLRRAPQRPSGLVLTSVGRTHDPAARPGVPRAGGTARSCGSARHWPCKRLAHCRPSPDAGRAPLRRRASPPPFTAGKFRAGGSGSKPVCRHLRWPTSPSTASKAESKPRSCHARRPPIGERRWACRRSAGRACVRTGPSVREPAARAVPRRTARPALPRSCAARLRVLRPCALQRRIDRRRPAGHCRAPPASPPPRPASGRGTAPAVITVSASAAGARSR